MLFAANILYVGVNDHIRYLNAFWNNSATFQSLLVNNPDFINYYYLPPWSLLKRNCVALMDLQTPSLRTDMLIAFYGSSLNKNCLCWWYLWSRGWSCSTSDQLIAEIASYARCSLMACFDSLFRTCCSFFFIFLSCDGQSRSMIDRAGCDTDGFINLLPR